VAEVRVGDVEVVYGFEVSRAIERLQGEVLFYDGFDDEAPQWLSPSKVPYNVILVVPKNPEEPVRAYLIREEYSRADILDFLMGLAEWYAEPGELVYFPKFAILIPPADLEKFEQYGCDSDGGNYCTTLYPIAWKNPKTRKAEFYFISESSCEICQERKIIVDKETGRLIDIEAEYAEDEENIWHTIMPEVYISEPMSREELIEAWKKNYEEWEEYN